MIDKSLPLAEIHRHLDGNIKPHTILKLAQKHQIDLGVSDLDQIASISQIHDKTSDLMAFLAKLDVGISVLADLDACYEVAYENIRDAKASGIDYVELRFSPNFMSQAHSLNMNGLTQAVADGVRAGIRDFGVEANLIGILSRTYGAQACMLELDALLNNASELVAIDLAGDELGYPAIQFVEHFKRVRDTGLQVTVHAGEADGPQSIWNAIELLGATRIGHGVAAAQDQKLVEYLANHEIAIESCPTSNYQTATVTDLAEHPMKNFLESGVLVTLNTDDPAVSNIDLAHEYEVAKQVVGLTSDQLRQVQINTFEAGFIKSEQRSRILSRYS